MAKTKAPTRFNKADSQLMRDILGWQKEARLKQPRYAKLRRMVFFGFLNFIKGRGAVQANLSA
jgi:hypothetical protein